MIGVYPFDHLKSNNDLFLKYLLVLVGIESICLRVNLSFYFLQDHMNCLASQTPQTVNIF